MNRVETIKSLIRFLPDKDISLANKFIESRDFESLGELIDSALYKFRRHRNDDEYSNINEEELCRLKSEVDTYSMMFDLPSDDYNGDDYEEII